jgi:tetratricopeptide (TPR) repeat protein
LAAKAPAAGRPPRIHHCTSQPYRFFGRDAELTLLDESLQGGPLSVVAFIGPGGQGKTATIQHWLEHLQSRSTALDGLFFWSFYRGKDSELCLRELHAYAEGLPAPLEVSASYCVDHLLPVLRRERWAVILDGLEVVQHESGPWFGRLVHPEMARLVEELAMAPMPGVLVLTSRFPVTGLELRRHAYVLDLAGLDNGSARSLLRSLGVEGDDGTLDAAAAACGRHAKAVELLGTYLVRFAGSQVDAWAAALGVSLQTDDAERQVAHVLGLHQAALSQESQDILTLATAFRDPPTEKFLMDYLQSTPVHTLLQVTWQRQYQPFQERSAGWVEEQLSELVQLRLLERVSGSTSGSMVIDAHPLVRRAFEHHRGLPDQRENSLARAGFLRGRPDRQKPSTLEEARDEVELFHAHCDAGLWNEADGVLVALDNPKHRFLAPAFERDLLLRFFSDGDATQSPLWPGFGRYRSLAICLELLGQFDAALGVYRQADAPLRGDALLALGRLQPLLDQPHVPHPWQALWSAYRCHALCLAGRVDDAVQLARSLVPVDIYEWVNVFECLLRMSRLDVLDLRSVLYRTPHAAEHRWAELARRRIKADYERVTASADQAFLLGEYAALVEAYDRAGLPYERALTRLGQCRLLMKTGQIAEAQSVNHETLAISRRHQMAILEADSWHVETELLCQAGETASADQARACAAQLRRASGYHGPPRP